MGSEPDRVVEMGQVFTRQDVVQQMLAMRKNKGRTLEPSAGDGAFSRHIDRCVTVEMDASVAPPGALINDFFAYPDSEKFSTVIGNPPYVRNRDILPGTKDLLNTSLFDRRSNLYLYFIEKCIRHLEPGGELIFIVPREFPKLTAARRLNSWIYRQGTITDYRETGDSPIFGKFVPNCAIFRFERGRMDRRMSDGRTFKECNGQLLFSHNDYTVPFSRYFDVKVGAVSGADEIFVHPKGNVDFVCSTTVDDGRPRAAYFDVINPHIERFKDRLLARAVRRFDETNWWKWGRHHHVSNAPRVYVNVKTRRTAPFFANDCKNYDGSVLAVFSKDPNVDPNRLAELLNDAVDWDDLGFVCDGRFLFTQRSLQTCFLPETFSEKWHALFGMHGLSHQI